MTKIQEDSLEFAREHISFFHDSDFFPKHSEFDAIWENWDLVKKALTNINIKKLNPYTPHVLPALKPKGLFRIVHQLEPIDAIVYTALAHSVATVIEKQRMSEEDDIACSYRLHPENGSFFGNGTGYQKFRNKANKLAKAYKFVLVTDISDFYNQIYIHRVENSVSSCGPEYKNIAEDIEHYLMALNKKTSQGVPVGPAGSIVFSEAVLIDVDTFIQDKGFEFTRYVDDYRLFSNSLSSLKEILQKLGPVDNQRSHIHMAPTYKKDMYDEASLSYRVAIRRNCFSFPNMHSTAFRSL